MLRHQELENEFINIQENKKHCMKARDVCKYGINCKYGKQCSYLHPIGNRPICKFGKCCSRGNSCQFWHNIDE